MSALPSKVPPSSHQACGIRGEAFLQFRHHVARLELDTVYHFAPAVCACAFIRSYGMLSQGSPSTQKQAFGGAVTDHAAEDGEHAAKDRPAELHSIHVVQQA